MCMQRLAITWLGHSTFLIRTPGGRRVLLDPWLRGNPACPDALKTPPACDLILVSHGHSDHMDDVIACARHSGAPVVAAFELCDWLGRKGLQQLAPMNIGGVLDVLGLRVTMTDARHSSGYVDNGQMVYMGEAAGFVIGLEDGRSVYFAGAPVFWLSAPTRKIAERTFGFLNAGGSSALLRASRDTWK